MRAQLARGGVVGQDGNGHGFVPVFHCFVDGAHGAAVQVLYGLYLQCYIALVSGFVAGFYVQVDEVVGLQRIQCGGYLVLVVGVIQSGGAFHVQAAQSGVVADAVYQVYGRDDGSPLHLREFVGQPLHAWTVAGTPGPDAVGGVLAFGHALQVDRMVFQ